MGFYGNYVSKLVKEHWKIFRISKVILNLKIHKNSHYLIISSNRQHFYVSRNLPSQKLTLIIINRFPISFLTARKLYTDYHWIYRDYRSFYQKINISKNYYTSKNFYKQIVHFILNVHLSRGTAYLTNSIFKF